MTVEILEFRVAPGMREEFIRRNEQSWTPALRRRSEFIRRDILVSDEDQDIVVILVQWRTRQGVERFPEAEQEALDERMDDLVRDHRQLLLDQVTLDEEPAGPTEGG